MKIQLMDHSLKQTTAIEIAMKKDFNNEKKIKFRTPDSNLENKSVFVKRNDGNIIVIPECSSRKIEHRFPGFFGE